MLRKLKLQGVEIYVTDLAGVRITYGETYCVDVVNPQLCHFKLYTHTHPAHFPTSPHGGIISPEVGRRVRPGEVLNLGRAVVKVVEAYNRDGGPHPRGLGVGYVLEIGGVKIYHMGDTSLIDEIAEVAREEIDILLVPVGGGGVMTPEEARDAVESLRPKVAIPIHFQNPRDLYLFRDMAQPYTQVVLLKKWTH
ncbi:MAG: MBL fold metallo-hydrolase [Pyrobaculum sp.]